jgi:glycosyltransferase involved in cell wall biosynthesis
MDMEQRKVVFLNRVYPPATGATGALLAEMTQGLARRDWDVTVVTGPVPEAPASEATDAGVQVERVEGFQFTEQDLWQRAWAYLALFPALLYRVLQLPAPDVIVTKTDPPMLKVLGPILRALTGARLVHWAQDLYPEVAEEVGLIAKRGPTAWLLRQLSTAALRHHDRIATVGRCMSERLIERGVRQHRVEVVPNWAPSAVHSVPHVENDFREAHASDDAFVVMYSGNLGHVHDFQAVLDAADRLRETRINTSVLLIGNGPRKTDLKRRVERRELDNIQFLPYQPWSRLAESLSAADLHLVTMSARMQGLVVPSKIYGALRAGRPVLFLGPENSEAARLIREHDCGTVLSKPTGESLAAAIRHWQTHPDRRANAGDRALAAARDGRDRAIDAFDDLLWEVIDEDHPSPKTAKAEAAYA